MPIPLGGGIAIFTTLGLAFIVGFTAIRFLLYTGRLEFLGDAVNTHATGFLQRSGELFVLFLCISILFVLGLIDDKKHLRPFIKLVFQFAVAFTAAVFADVRIEFFIENTVVTSVLSAFWIVLIINVFNFLDNMDGASAGTAIICSAVLFAAAVMSGQVYVGGLALIFVGTMAGFLVFNFPPAKIFMGDCGSLLVGFFIAVLTLKTTYYHQDSSAVFPIFLPLIVMAVPLYDFVSVTFLRISQGKSPFVGDTQHFSHRLKRRGLTDTQVALALYLAVLTTGIGAVLLYYVDLAGAVLIFLQTVMILFIIAVFESTGRNKNDTK